VALNIINQPTNHQQIDLFFILFRHIIIRYALLKKKTWINMLNTRRMPRLSLEHQSNATTQSWTPDECHDSVLNTRRMPRLSLEHQTNATTQSWTPDECHDSVLNTRQMLRLSLEHQTNATTQSWTPDECHDSVLNTRTSYWEIECWATASTRCTGI
jgi:hypothetical protein